MVVQLVDEAVVYLVALKDSWLVDELDYKMVDKWAVSKAFEMVA